MGCMHPQDKDRERTEKHDSAVTLAEGERVELSYFTSSLSKRSLDHARPSNYQSFQAPLQPPVLRHNQPVSLPTMSDYDILTHPQERTYKVPKVTYPRLELAAKHSKN